ncbi:MAG: HAMP domain-containing histidine kinase [Gemmatimonadales bacterium]|nr:HAMP domain-containing histidine kinase [Gemmatimonadales bacterium]
MSTNLQTEKIDHGSFDQVILGIAHELNNPNTFVRLNATNLKKMLWLLRPCLEEYEQNHPGEKLGPYPMDELRTKINQQIEGILNATVRIIVVADKLKQCTSESLEQVSPISMRDIIQDMLREHAFIMQDKVEVETDLPADEPCQIIGFRLQMEQAVSVLITNAVDAIGEQHKEGDAVTGRLRIKLAMDKNLVTLSIGDNGCGIDKKNLAKVFTPYFSTKPQGVGDGMGLPICRSIIDRHGGTITLDSEPGTGTEVQIVLPHNRSE